MVDCSIQSVFSTSFLPSLPPFNAASTVESGDTEEEVPEEEEGAPVYTLCTCVWVGIMLTRVEAERAAS
jgi:hypothetical protein